jgi:hypothetical protein
MPARHRMRLVTHNIVGKWRLIDMAQWDQDFIDLVEPGFISFQKAGHGGMRFGAVNLSLDWERNDNGKVEFSFEGFDELDEVSGRGWAKMRSGRLTGLLRFHQGETSGFTAKPWSSGSVLDSRSKPDSSKQRCFENPQAGSLRLEFGHLDFVSC